MLERFNKSYFFFVYSGSKEAIVGFQKKGIRNETLLQLLQLSRKKSAVLPTYVLYNIAPISEVREI